MEANHTIPPVAFPLAHSRKSRSKTKSKQTVRKIAFYLTVALVFIRCSQAHELVNYRFHINAYVLFIVGIPAILGLIISKSLLKSFRFPQAYFWLGFSVWMALTIPFAIWKGGSAQIVEDYWRTNTILFILLGGLTTTWKEFERLLQVLALSCVVNLVIIKIYGELDVNGRMTVPFGALANSNDFAAHLLMLLPCVLWVALTTKSFKFRVAILGVFGYGIFAVLSSGSRGALISVAVGTLYFLFLASTKRRIWAVGLIAVMMFTAFSLLSEQAKQRMFSFSKSSSASEEALESSDIRQRVLEDAIGYALRYPIFGLGPGNFRHVEGKSKPGMWEPAHNSYVTIATECGLPGLLLFVGGVGLSFQTFWRIRRKFQCNPEASKVAQAAACMQLMMITFCLAVGFLNFGFAFHFPLMVGISIAMAYAAESWRSGTQPSVQIKSPRKDKEKKRSKIPRKRSDRQVAATGMDTWRKGGGRS
jgi:O-antigen ligase